MRILIIAAFFAVILLNFGNGQDLQQTQQNIDNLLRQCYTDITRKNEARALPQSMDYLLYLVEKVQRHPKYQNANAAATALSLLLRFQRNGFKDYYSVSNPGTADVSIDQTERVKQTLVNLQLAQNVQNNTNYAQAPIVYPEGYLYAVEECALHFMLSFSYNTTYTGYYMYNGQVVYPREGGAVYAGMFGNIAMGPVFQGIAASGARNDVVYVRDLVINTDPILGLDTFLNSPIDVMYGTTLAAELGQSAVVKGIENPVQTSYGQSLLVGPDGTWNNTQCSNVYMQGTNYSSSATSAEILGGIDGMIICGKLRDYRMQGTVSSKISLSQILRMYYGRGLEDGSYSACDRGTQYSRFASGVDVNTKNFAIAYYMRSPQGTANAVNEAVTRTLNDYKQFYSPSKFECNDAVTFDRKCDLINDIVFVMDIDSSNSDNNFFDQKQLILNIMRDLDMNFNGSRYSIFTNGGSPREIVPYKNNQPDIGAYQRCYFNQLLIDTSRPNMVETVKAVKNKFRALRSDQAMRRVPSGAGKVVIFIYNEGNMDNQDQFKNEMNQFKYEFRDVTILAVGKNIDMLKLIVRNDKYDAITATSGALQDSEPKVMKRLCTAPTTVEYPDCVRDDLSNERQFVFTDYLYRDSTQWFAVPSTYFNISQSFKLGVGSNYGSVKVCITRQYPPSLTGLPSQCKDTGSASTTGQTAIFGPDELCYNYPDGNCPPLYFVIQGKTESSERCLNKTCPSLYQTQITIAHEGARCDGSLTRVTFTLMFLGLIASFFS